MGLGKKRVRSTSHNRCLPSAGRSYPFLPSPTPPPKVEVGWLASGSGVAVPYNESKQRLWLVDLTLFFPSPTPPPKVEVGWLVSGSGVAVPYNEGKQRLWLVDPTLFFPSPTPPPKVEVGLLVSGSGVAVPYNEGKQRLWLVDPTLFFPSPTPPPKVEVGWLVSGSGVAVPYNEGKQRLYYRETQRLLHFLRLPTRFPHLESAILLHVLPFELSVLFQFQDSVPENQRIRRCHPICANQDHSQISQTMLFKPLYSWTHVPRIWKYQRWIPKSPIISHSYYSHWGC